MRNRLSRREALGTAGAAAGAAALSAFLPRSVVDTLAAAPCGSLNDIEHIVIFINENRSFDHYFGTYKGVAGFQDPSVRKQSNGLSIFNQALPAGQDFGTPHGYLQPFHLDTATTNAECTNDISHEWAAQHGYWNNGAMDSFATGHFKADGAINYPLTMGYYTREDLAFFHALADAFTICDHYHCSVIGPTDPNRLYSMSASLGADGQNGGPILKTYVTNRYTKFGTLNWLTMPEVLQKAGISWKVYGDPDGNFGDNVLAYFKNYLSDLTLAANAFVPTFPGTFQLDAALGTLPQVSWVLASLLYSEHPPAPPDGGQYVVSQLLSALTANPAVWAKTALFVTYDENGGFFDHVPPPTPPAGTAREYLTVSPLPPEAGGIAGPIGLGFRVPMLVISPFTRGGFVCSQTFDHTSLLRFVETRFKSHGVTVPNLSDWRRSVTGDLTGAFNFAASDSSVPSLPATAPLTPVVLKECVPSSIISELQGGSPSLLNPPYPVPKNGGVPPQEPGTAKNPSGPVACANSPTSSSHALTGGGPSPAGLVAAAALGALAWLSRRRSSLGAESAPAREAHSD